MGGAAGAGTVRVCSPLTRVSTQWVVDSKVTVDSLGADY